jgi:DNA-binding PadR family transcriptional regulator
MRGEVIKNHLELLVLTALKTEPGHGYSIIRAVRDRSDGEFELLEGSLYPALHRLSATEWSRAAGRTWQGARAAPCLNSKSATGAASSAR